MLILTRKPGESLYIGDQIKITINEIKGNQVRVGIDAPSDLRIYREEIYLQILEENRSAAKALSGELPDLGKAWEGRSGGMGNLKTGLNPQSRLGGLTTASVGKTEGKNPEVVVRRKKGDIS